MNLFILHYYTVVCETGSMARAAEKLSLSRQALSKAILALESEVGARLLTRRSSGVVPTPAGEVLLRHARILLRDWDAALAELEARQRDSQGVQARLREEIAALAERTGELERRCRKYL